MRACSSFVSSSGTSAVASLTSGSAALTSSPTFRMKPISRVSRSGTDSNFVVGIVVNGGRAAVQFTTQLIIDPSRELQN